MPARAGYFLIALAVLILPGCATVPKPSETLVDLQALCEQHLIEWDADPVSQVVTLHYGGKTAKALLGSETVILGTSRVQLSAPIRRESNRVLVAPDFESKVIAPLVHEPAVAAKKKLPYRIVIDPGHGGKDPGAIGRTGLFEKDVVLDIAKRLQAILVKQGCQVTLTRDRDIFLELSERTEIASRAMADIFISIHANSNPSASVHGTEVYTLRQLNREEEREEQRQKNYRMVFKNLEMDRQHTDLTQVLEELMYEHKKAESSTMARYLSVGLSRRTQLENRGVKPAGFFVIRNNLMPAVLVELGYLSNSREERYMQSSEYRQKAALGLAESIIAYLNQI